MKTRDFITALIIMLCLGFLFTSCKKEEVIFEEPCNCGIITDKGYFSWDGGLFWYDFTNECTGIEEKFYVDSLEWNEIEYLSEKCF